MATIQNFSISRGNSLDVTVDVQTNVVGETLVGATIFWRVYEQAHGVVATDAAGALLPPVIEKVTGHGIIVLASPPMEFVITIEPADTLSLDGNYYHEAEIVDASGNHVTPTQGVMTVTQAEVTQ